MVGEGSGKRRSYSAVESGCKGHQHQADTFWRAEEDHEAGCGEQKQQPGDEPPLLEAR